MKRVLLHSAWLLLCLTHLGLQAEQTPRAMTPVDLLSLAAISDGQLSKDGQTLIYRQRQVHWQRDKWIHQLWRKNLASGESRQLTFGRQSVSDPLLSPDGKSVVFMTRRHKDKRRQIYRMYLDGGEAFKLAELDMTAGQLTWSEDGQFLYFSAYVPKSKKHKKRDNKLAIIKAFEDPQRKKALWRIEVSSGTLEQLTSGDLSVVSYSLSADPNKVLLSLAPGNLLDQRHQAELWLLDLKRKHSQQLTDNDYYERSARLAKDGKRLVYTATVNGQGENYYSNNLFLLDIKTGHSQLLTADFTGEVEGYTWSKEQASLFFVANIGVSNHLFQLELASVDIQQLTQGAWSINEWFYQAESDSHIIEKVSATEPGDIWRWQPGELSRLTYVHQHIQQQFQLPKQQKISWLSDDKQALEGLLTYPLDYQPGKAFPLVVQTHGGPRSSDQYGLWSFTDHLPVLAAHGYGILMVNHRGGTGYGDAFLRDMVGQYFRHAHLDVLSGVDHLIKQGLADGDKLVKMGWSAGGHMTNKLITYSNRFKAASSGAGTVDWLSHYAETDTAYKRTWWFGGKPWQKDAPLDAFRADSMIDKLWKVTTPTLIFVGEEDVRVPSSQSKMLFRGLRDNGVETELYIAPGEPHGFTRPSHRLFKTNKELEWFEHHLFQRKYQHQAIPKAASSEREK